MRPLATRCLHVADLVVVLLGHTPQFEALMLYTMASEKLLLSSMLPFQTKVKLLASMAATLTLLGDRKASVFKIQTTHNI